jgi:hypothetical protein
MKSSLGANFRWIPLALAATLMGKLTVSAQDWRTVDDFALAGADAEAHGVAIDSAGRIYVVGMANWHGIVRYSVDAGTNWSTRDDFVYPSESRSLFNAITIDHQGDVFVGGGSGGHWIVRRSTDQGVTWETVDDYYRPMNGPSNPGTNGIVYSLSCDGQGRVYGTGLMRPTGPSYNFWWVRGSEIGGTNWDSKLVLFSGYNEVSQMTWAGEDVYVTGNVDRNDNSFTGLIMKSSDYGATWTTNFVATLESYNAIASDAAGNVYSAGSRSTSNPVNWVVRKKTPGGTSWTIVDQTSLSGYPLSMAVDAAGNICVVGQPWLTRQYSAANDQWTTDMFSYSTNTAETAMGTAIAPDGSTFVVGYGTSDSGQHRWVVRKQSAFTPPPRLQIVNAGAYIAVSWPAAYTNAILQWTDSSGGNQGWQTFTGATCVTNGRNTATVELAPGARFFRLKSASGQ